MDLTLYVIELDELERQWLSELVDSRVHQLNKDLCGAIGDDREAWLREVKVAERVNEEGCLGVTVPKSALIDAHVAEQCKPLVEALRNCQSLARDNNRGWSNWLDIDRYATEALAKFRGGE